MGSRRASGSARPCRGRGGADLGDRTRRLERAWELHPRALSLGPDETDRTTAYALARRHAGVDTSPSAGANASAFVGRERELGLLHDAFMRATQRHGQAVFITGDAGIGKSRLLTELRAQLADTPHQWIEGRCAAYGKAIPFLPALDAADLELRNATEHRAPKIAARAHRLLAAAFLAMQHGDDAESALVASRTIAEKIGHQRAQWEAYRGLAELATRRGDHRGAAHHAAAARASAERSAQSLADASLRQGLMDAVTTGVWFS